MLSNGLQSIGTSLGDLNFDWKEIVSVMTLPMQNTSAQLAILPVSYKVPTLPADCVVLRFTDYIPWNNPYDVTSLETEQAFQTFVNGAMLPLLFLISFPTNLLNMIVFYKQGLRERVNFCLFAQSAIDFAYIIYVFAINSDNIYLKVTNQSRYSLVSRIFFEYKLVGFYGLAWASEVVTTVIACERCFCVMSPLRSQSVIKTKTTVAFVLSVSSVLIGGFFVVGARWSVRCVYDPLTNSTSLTAFPSAFYVSHREVVDILDGVFYGLLVPGLTITIVAVTTCLTTFKLRKMATWRQQTSSAAVGQMTRDLTLTRMLIGTSVMFLVCNIPGITARTVILVVPDLSIGGRYRNSYNVIIFSNQLAWNINSSFHFFIYYSLGSKFRETLQEIFRPKHLKVAV